MSSGRISRRTLVALAFGLLLISPQVRAESPRYDLVIEGGRVINPETGLDAVRNVGVRGGKVVAVTEERLAGARVIHAEGLVVAPASSTCTPTPNSCPAPACRRSTG